MLSAASPIAPEYLNHHPSEEITHFKFDTLKLIGATLTSFPAPYLLTSRMERIIDAPDEVAGKPSTRSDMHRLLNWKISRWHRQIAQATHKREVRWCCSINTCLMCNRKKGKAPIDVHICIQCKETFAEEENGYKEFKYISSRRANPFLPTVHVEGKSGL